MTRTRKSRRRHLQQACLTQVWRPSDPAWLVPETMQTAAASPVGSNLLRNLAYLFGALKLTAGLFYLRAPSVLLCRMTILSRHITFLNCLQAPRSTLAACWRLSRWRSLGRQRLGVCLRIPAGWTIAICLILSSSYKHCYIHQVVVTVFERGRDYAHHFA